MATLTLPKTFINLVSTGAAVSALTVPGRSDDYEVPGESRLYAGGRRRSIVQAGQIATVPITLTLVSTANLAILRSWAGQMVQVRDTLGRRFFGVYRKVSAAEVRGGNGEWTVSITLDALTFDEGV
jgi:hypothetical protein